MTDDIQVGDVCLDLTQGRPAHVLGDTRQRHAFRMHVAVDEGEIAHRAASSSPFGVMVSGAG